jgi:hypothetical protein
MTSPVLLLADAGSPDMSPAWRPATGDEYEPRSGPSVGRVLVVEDEAMVRSYLARLLREFGHSVEIAANGADGWRLALAAPAEFDLVITDVRMPVRDGWSSPAGCTSAGPGSPCSTSPGTTSSRRLPRPRRSSASRSIPTI